MGIAYHCDPDLRCTFVVWNGDVTPDEWRNHVETLFGDEAFPPGPLLLADLRTAGGAAAITADVITEVGARFNAEAETLGEMKLAVVPNGAWDKARQLVDRDISAPGLRAIAFATSSAAFMWLGLNPEDAEPILDELRAKLRSASRT